MLRRRGHGNGVRELRGAVVRVTRMHYTHVPNCQSINNTAPKKSQESPDATMLYILKVPQRRLYLNALPQLSDTVFGDFL